MEKIYTNNYIKLSELNDIIDKLAIKFYTEQIVIELFINGRHIFKRIYEYSALNNYDFAEYLIFKNIHTINITYNEKAHRIRVAIITFYHD